MAGLAVAVLANESSGPVGNAQLVREAHRLAERLDVPVLEECFEPGSGVEFILRVSADGLLLELNRPGAPSPLRVDFESPALDFRIKDRVGRQALSRAVGVKPGLHPAVLDATAGLGKDAYLLAMTGSRVRLLERNPVIHALLDDGLRRARKSAANNVRDAALRMELSLTSLAEFAESSPRFEVVYLDPMFPARSKSARVKKDMYILQQFFADSDQVSDEAALLRDALAIAQRRVVVKRPARAPDLGGKVPTFRISGRTSRFDVYVTG